MHLMFLKLLSNPHYKFNQMRDKLTIMRQLVIVCVSFSLSAALLLVFVVPFLHYKIQNIHIVGHEELQLCRIRISNFWKEIGKIKVKCIGRLILKIF